MQNSVLWIKCFFFFLRPDKLKVILPICLYFRTQAGVITDAINLGQLLNSTSTYSIHIHRYIERSIHTYMDWLSEHWIEYVIKEEMNFVLSALPWISCHFFLSPSSPPKVMFSTLRSVPCPGRRICVFFYFIVFFLLFLWCTCRVCHLSPVILQNSKLHCFLSAPLTPSVNPHRRKEPIKALDTYCCVAVRRKHRKP